MMSEIEFVTEVMISVAAGGFLAWIVFYFLPLKNNVTKAQRPEVDEHRINSIKDEGD